MSTLNVSRYLLDNFAPVHEERTQFDLSFDGAIPEALDGLYVRNGPNPAALPETAYHWFTGDGMVHGLALGDGRPLWYRNRWVRTEALAASTGWASPDGPPDVTIAGAGIAPANTHVVSHGGMLLALCETSLPVRLTTDLETVGRHDYDGAVRRIAFNAHPKVDPVTGELHVIGYDVLEQPFVRYHVVGADGTYLRGVDIETGGPSMMHDFALTAEHVVLFDLPVVFDLDLAAQDAPLPFRWSDAYEARIGVLRRDDPAGAVRWFEIPPCYVFHFLNAYDDDGTVVVDGFRYDHALAVERDGLDDGVGTTLCRWTVDLGSGVVKEDTIDDRTAELPYVDPRRVGRRHRFGYAVGHGALFRAGGPSGFYKYDLRTGAVLAHRLPSGLRPDEAVFVPAGPDAEEDDGWLLAYVYDVLRDRSDLVVLDAADFTAPPVATVHLPGRIPHGFHGSWVPAAG